ncbi:MAG TPA: S-layer homology domain-containing protein [Clostridiales bacterium]|nr:S-layer homology domain-containing protein [Clostridiales bacterium]
MKIEKVGRRLIIAFLCLAAIFMFSGGVSAAWEAPDQDLLTMLEGAASDNGDPVKVSVRPTINSNGETQYVNYVLELPYGSTATEITLPDSDKTIFVQCFPSDADDYKINLSSEDSRFHLPVTGMLMTRLWYEPYYQITVNLAGKYVYIAYESPVSDFAITPSSAYAAQKQWINIGGTFDLNNTLFSDDTPISVYLSTEENGDVAKAVGEPLITTKGQLLADAGVEDGVIKVTRYQKGVGLLAENLKAGTYYVTMKIGEGDKVLYLSKPYTVHATAKEYAKAAMDRLIGYYITAPELKGNKLDSFPAQMAMPIKMQLTNLKNAGYDFYDARSGGIFSFYETFSPGGNFSVYMEPYYTGLAYYKDTGTDWEAWIFTALGDKYLYEPSSGSSQWLDFSGDSALLSGKSLLTMQNISAWIASDDDQTWMDTYGQELQKFGVDSDYDLTQYFIASSSPYNKEAFRRTAALIAMGADPRNPFSGESYNANHVAALMYTFYDQATVTWDENGTADYSQAKLRLDENGRLPFWDMDPLNLSYCMLALEMANASPEEGYTTEMRQAFLNSFLPLIEEQLAGFLKGEGTGDGDPDAGGGYTDAFAVDTCAMLSLPLCYAAEDPVYGERIEKIFEVMPTAFGAIVDSLGGADNYYGTNSNSVAMAVNALVSAGYDAADLEGTEFQGTYQTLLSSLVNCQLDDSSISYGQDSSGNGNRMATYQTLGALVDLYNGESCFTLHRNDYLYHYPQYTDGGHEFTALLGSLPDDGDDLKWNQVPTVVAARTVYDGLLASLDKSQQKQLPTIFADQLTILADLEANTGAAVGAAMGRLPGQDQVKLSDRAHVEAVRAAYDSLTEGQKAIADGENNVNISRLWGAERGLAQWDAKEVSNLILSLPSPEDVTALDRADIEAARAAYDGLSKEQQLLVDGATLKVLRDAERALTTLDAKNVMKAIDALPNTADVRITDKNKITSVRGSYDALSDDQKSLVTNYSKLLDVEEVFSNLVVKAVETAILALPDANKVTKTDENAIKSARTAYDALTVNQKEAISVTVLARLTAAEAALEKAGKVTIDDLVDMQDTSAWYYDAVAKCVEEGLFKGDADRRFNPKSNMTRAEFSQVLYNYYRDDANVMKDGAAKTFGDVKSGAWYYDAVTACAKAGLINGDDKGKFNPNQPILRQDVALIMMRVSIGSDAIDELDVDALLKDLAKKNLVFSDFYDTSAYAQKAMAAAAGVIFFGDNGKLYPQSNITRAEMAQVMYNYLFK